MHTYSQAEFVAGAHNPHTKSQWAYNLDDAQGVRYRQIKKGYDNIITDLVWLYLLQI